MLLISVMSLVSSDGSQDYVGSTIPQFRTVGLKTMEEWNLYTRRAFRFQNSELDSKSTSDREPGLKIRDGSRLPGPGFQPRCRVYLTFAAASVC